MSIAQLLSLRHFFFLVIPVVLSGLAGCGGGGGSAGGGGGGGSSNANFSLSVNPSSISIPPATSATVSLLAIATGGFSSTVSVQVGGLPSGVSVTPSSITLQPGSAQSVTIAATSSAGLGNSTLTFTGTAGSISQTTELPLSVVTALVPSRTKYVRTDAATEYFIFFNTQWTVYSPTTNRFFVTDPGGNHVFVMDASSETLLATLDVPGAFGIDNTANDSEIYVGTLIGDVYTIDPVAMAVTGRFIASQIGPFGFSASSAMAMSDGRVALLGAPSGLETVDGFSSLAVWNPTNNAITIYATPFNASFFPAGVPVTTVCGALENIAGFARTADRTQILIGSADSDSTLCEINETTGSYNFTTAADFPVLFNVSADGKYIAARSSQNGSALLFDASSLELLAQFPVNGDLSSAASFAFSGDSSTLFISSSTIVYAYNVSTQKQVGWLPNLVLEPIASGLAEGPITGPAIAPVGNTGLLAGPMEEGVGFLDTSALQTGTVGTQFLNAYPNPSFGPAAGGTTVTIADPNSVNSSVNSVYFGTGRSFSDGVTGGLFSMFTPPGQPGPVAVDVLMNDGGQLLIPDGFSYGPTILEVTPNASTAEGGGTGIIYGYGFGSASSNSVPSGLSVTVGSQTATVTAYTGNAYELGSPPFQLQAFAYTIPPGTAGSAVNITVTNSAGSATAPAAMTYLPETQLFTAGTTPLAQGIYDPLRNVYYFSDTNLIRVFSLANKAFLPSISIPAPAPGAAQRLWGLSLSADDSKLAIADEAANVIYVLDPDTPGTVSTFPLPSPGPTGVVSDPVGVAISDSGFVYYATVVGGGFGFDSFFKLDTTSKAVTNYGIVASNLATDVYLRNAISTDNTRVYFNNDGAPFTIDTATDQVTSAVDQLGCCNGNYELALASNQTRFAATDFFYDSDLNAESFTALNDREVLNIAYVYGNKLSPDGSLLFQPSTNGIDVLDGRLGTLLERIAVPYPLSTQYDALVVDGKDNVLLAIVGQNANEIAVIDLSSVPEPAPLPYTASSARASSVFQLAQKRLRKSVMADQSTAASGARTVSNLPPRPPLGTTVPHATTLTPAPKLWPNTVH